MRTYFIAIGVLIFSFGQLNAQRACLSSDHLQNELQNNSSLAEQLNRIEGFIQHQLQVPNTSSRIFGSTIKIPVVVHILYHLPGENISDEQVYNQIDMLNKCYRRTNPDTANTPARFKSRAADCEMSPILKEEEQRVLFINILPSLIGRRMTR